jgi:DNA-binding response OmpR family regulator
VVLELGSADGREFELLDHVRKTEALSTLFVVSIAAGLDDQATLAAFERGTDELLSLTIPDAELRARVRAILRRIVLGRGGGQFVFQDISLDAENRRIRIGGREETLTRTEYQLLHLFIQKAGRTLPRRYLLRYLWNSDDQFRTRSIDMHVSHLRRKLAPSSCRIDTVRPLGYKLTTVR